MKTCLAFPNDLLTMYVPRRCHKGQSAGKRERIWLYVSRLHTTGPKPFNLVATSTHAHTFYGGPFGARTASSEGSGRSYRAGIGRRRIVLILNLRIRRAAGEFHRGECRDGRETRARTLTRSLDVRFGGVRAADQDKY